MIGTPVIAFNLGSMPELILNGKTGFLVQNIAEAAEAVPKVESINRKDCRAWALSKFSSQKMASDYLEVFKTVLNKQED